MAVSSTLLKLLNGQPWGQQPEAPAPPPMAPSQSTAQTTPDAQDVVTAVGKPHEDNPWIRGLMTFMGYQPKGGFDDSDPEYIGNAVRGLFGLDSAQSNVNQMNSEKEAAAELTDKQARRDALKGGDVTTIAQTDPVAAGQVQSLGFNKSNQDFLQSQRDALAAGDVDAIAKVNPDAAKAILGLRAAKDSTRRDAAMRMAQAADQVAKASGQPYGSVLSSMAAQSPGIMADQDLQIATSGGFDAVSRSLQGAPKPLQALNSDTDTIKVLNDDGTVLDTGVSRNKSADIARLMNADSARINANKPRAGQKGGGGDQGAMLSKVLDNMSALLDEGVANGAFYSSDTPAGDKNAIITKKKLAQVPVAGDYVGAGEPWRNTLQKMDSAASTAISAMRLALQSQGINIGSSMLNSEKEWQRVHDEIFNPNASADVVRAAIQRWRDVYISEQKQYGLSGGSGSDSGATKPRVVANSDGTTSVPNASGNATTRVRIVNPDGSITFK